MSHAYRRVKGGRPEVKRVLFMAAIVAVMRKMIVTGNARLRDALAVAWQGTPDRYSVERLK